MSLGSPNNVPLVRDSAPLAQVFFWQAYGVEKSTCSTADVTSCIYKTALHIRVLYSSAIDIWHSAYDWWFIRVSKWTDSLGFALSVHKTGSTAHSYTTRVRILTCTIVVMIDLTTLERIVLRLTRKTSCHVFCQIYTLGSPISSVVLLPIYSLSSLFCLFYVVRAKFVAGRHGNLLFAFCRSLTLTVEG